MFKKILRVILSRSFAFAILALLQIGLVVALFYYLSQTGLVAYSIITIVTVLALVAVLEKDDLNPAYKLMWVTILVVMPVTGTLFYLMWGHRIIPRKIRRLLQTAEDATKGVLHQNQHVIKAVKSNDASINHLSRYLLNCADAPVYAGTTSDYYSMGEDFFPVLLEELDKAEKFIFMEYFIIEEGLMWNSILEVLRRKAAQGVDVRVMYDGLGSLFTLPGNFAELLRKDGIQCYAFSPIRFTIHVREYAMLNHRDHRKICVIDGNTAFSGGVNLADEYINHVQRFGTWKDNAFMLRGDAVYSLTVSFLRLWGVSSNTMDNYSLYKPDPVQVPDSSAGMWAQGFVQPYTDSPLDTENVAENAYLNVINHARRYVYLCTPYLILDSEMISCLSLAAKSGVDVRIITPGIPDKKMIFLLTQSYYPALLAAGVRIYEYTPGFIHSKMYLSDDRLAITGSANMDYRSLYLHFENCVGFYGGKMISRIKTDMLGMIDVGTEVLLSDVRNIGFFKRLLQIFFRFFAPML